MSPCGVTIQLQLPQDVATIVRAYCAGAKPQKARLAQLRVRRLTPNLFGGRHRLQNKAERGSVLHS
jgi:hypothetical protein